MNRLVTIIIFLSFFNTSVFAQQKSSKGSTQKAAVAVLARAQKNKILLRWVVNQATAWKVANQHGFIVERYTVLRNGKALQQPEKKLLTSQPLLPQPLAEWKELIGHDDNAAVIAQCIYGESFIANPEIKAANLQGLSAITHAADELQQRFAYSLMAAERSFKGAQMAGWGLEDTTAKADEKYLYRVYTAVPANKTKIDTSGVFIGLKDYAPLPVPKDLYASFKDKTALLSWNNKLLENFYIGYYVERSEDGKNFTKISDLPIANLSQGDARQTRTLYVDSLKENNKTYTYRVMGITSFGELGPPSEVVQGAGKETMTNIPRIYNAVVNNNEVELQWEMQDTANTMAIDHFELSQAATVNGVYKTVMSKIASTKRKAVFSKLLPSNYFVLAAVTKTGSRAASFPYLVQSIDSVPPAAPVGLKALIDTLGRVTLKWDANKEPDLMGYQVFTANLPSEEPTLLTSRTFNHTYFRDTVNLKSLNSEIYYAVVALDKRYNRSAFSIKVKVQKPDKVPPVAPLFAQPEIGEKQTKITWINSSSLDIALHKLYRKDISDKTTTAPWELVKEITDTSVHSFVDKQLEAGHVYAYLIVAMDKAGNESPAHLPLTVHAPRVLVKPAVKNLQAQADRQNKKILISWRYEEKDVVEQQVYKAIAKEPITLWKVVPARQKEIQDTNLSPGNNYTYAVRAVFKDGSYSDWKEITTEY